MGVDKADEFYVVERSYSDDASQLSVGLANISAVVPDVEANKDKVLRVAKIFKERGVNVGVLPEFCLRATSGRTSRRVASTWTRPSWRSITTGSPTS